MRRSVLLTLVSIRMLSASAQVVIYGAGDPAAAALEHLDGPNVLLSNAFSQTIEPQQVGIFGDSTASIGLDSGLVICTGICYGVLGPNNMPNTTFGGGFGASDPDIATMSLLYAGSIFDPGIIQMDLVPEGDTLEVRYVFGSEEYDEYVCSDKDDRMGLFLSGPGIAGNFSNGAINMATLPATGLPVTVNTLNRGISGALGSLGLCGMNPEWLMDTIYYINNDFGLNTQLDAYTVVLTARAVVIPGSTYHLKIAIADVNDGNFDSAVFLPEGAIRCTDLSTGMNGITTTVDRGFWLSGDDHVVNVHGLTTNGGPVLVEAFDPAGRLLQRSQATPNGAAWNAPLRAGLRGMVVLRATQEGHVVTGRVFIP